MTQRRQHVRAMTFNLLAVGLVIGGVLALKHFAAIDLPGWLRLVALVAVLAGTTAFVIAWWRALDEVAREAHKFAWYWGGSAGIVVAGAVMILVDSERMAVPHFILPGPHGDFAAGCATVLLAQVIGYTAAWAGWWWSHR